MGAMSSQQSVLPAPGQWRIADLDLLPDDGRHYELADGHLIVSPMARRTHGIASKELGRLLEQMCPPELYVFPLPISVDDPDATHFEPDLSVVRREFAEIENGDVPLLAVEVRSPSTAGVDAGRKRAGYARIGVPSYWLVDGEVPSIVVLELREGSYVEVARAVGAQRLELERPFPITLSPQQLQLPAAAPPA